MAVNGSPNAYFSISELAQLWNVSPDTIRREIDRGALRATRFGQQCIRISPVEAARFVRERTPNV